MIAGLSGSRSAAGLALRCWLVPLAAAVALVACSGEWAERSRPIHTDLTGTWPVACRDLRLPPGGTPCTLTGLVLTLRQNDGGGDPFTASFNGTHSAATLSCEGSPAVAYGAGPVAGSLRGHIHEMTFSNGSRFVGEIFSPSLSITLVELRGSMSWLSPNGQAAGQCTAGPIETRSH